MLISHSGIPPVRSLCLTHEGISVEVLSLAEIDSMTPQQYEDFSTNLIKLLLELKIIENIGTLTDDPNQKIRIGVIPNGFTQVAKGVKNFIKYTTKESYEEFISKGSFRFGSIIDYRFNAPVHAKDPLEGFCNIRFRGGNSCCSVSAFAGRNLRLFCGSSEPNSEYLKKKFGSVRLSLKDCNAFGSAVAGILGAKSWHLGEVIYSAGKVYDSDCAINLASLSPAYLETNHLSAIKLHDLIVNKCIPETVYLKPVRYKPEKECRFVFEMNEDFTEPNFGVENLDLLDFFDVSIE